MTKVILNGTIKGLRGKLGNLIFRQMPDGTTVVTTAQPKMNSRQKKRAKLKRSPAQQAHNSRFEGGFLCQGSPGQTVLCGPCRRHADEDRHNLPSRLVGAAGDPAHRAAEGRILECDGQYHGVEVRVSIWMRLRFRKRERNQRREGDCWEFASRHRQDDYRRARDLPGHVTKFVATPSLAVSSIISSVVST
jgi:hypothetical protein